MEKKRQRLRHRGKERIKSLKQKQAERKTEAGQKEGLQQAGGRGEARVRWRPGLGQPPPWRPMSTCIQRLVLSTSSPEPHPISAFLSCRRGGTRPREKAVLACRPVHPQLSQPCAYRLCVVKPAARALWVLVSPKGLKMPGLLGLCFKEEARR